MIRVANRSDVELRDVIVKYPSQTEKYGNLPPNEVSGFRRITRAYSYAYIQAVVDGKEAVIQPEDYVGERLLRPGSYTYALAYNPAATDKYDRLWLKLEKE
jgi:hypothetical protein